MERLGPSQSTSSQSAPVSNPVRNLLSLAQRKFPDPIWGLRNSPWPLGESLEGSCLVLGWKNTENAPVQQICGSADPEGSRVDTGTGEGELSLADSYSTKPLLRISRRHLKTCPASGLTAEWINWEQNPVTSQRYLLVKTLKNLRKRVTAALLILRVSCRLLEAAAHSERAVVAWYPRDTEH